MCLVSCFFYPLFFPFYCIFVLPSFFICFSPLHILLQPQFSPGFAYQASERRMWSNHCSADLTKSRLTRALPSLLPQKKDVQGCVSTAAPGVGKVGDRPPFLTKHREDSREPQHRATVLLPFQQGCSGALPSPRRSQVTPDLNALGET